MCTSADTESFAQGKVRRMRPSPFNKSSGASKSRLAPAPASKQAQPASGEDSEVSSADQFGAFIQHLQVFVCAQHMLHQAPAGCHNVLHLQCLLCFLTP